MLKKTRIHLQISCQKTFVSLKALIQNIEIPWTIKKLLINKIKHQKFNPCTLSF